MNVISAGGRARDLVVRVVTPSVIVDNDATTLGQWVARVVNHVYPTPDHSYGYVVVAGPENYLPVNAATGRPQTQIVVCVHDMNSEQAGYVTNSIMDDAGLVVLCERNSSPATLEPSAVAQCIRDGELEPPFELSAVGVSGVSCRYAPEMWSEIVSVDRNYMDGSGGGFMVHPMWINGGDHTVREMSGTFGWGAEYALMVGALEPN